MLATSCGVTRIIFQYLDDDMLFGRCMGVFFQNIFTVNVYNNVLRPYNFVRVIFQNGIGDDLEAVWRCEFQCVKNSDLETEFYCCRYSGFIENLLSSD